MRFVTLAAVISLLSSSLSVAREDASTYERERILAAGQAYISAIEFPPPEKAVGFKSLNIGAEFDLDSPAVTAYVDENDGVGRSFDPYICKLAYPFPMLACKVSLWNTDRADRGGYSHELLNLETAFGSKVKVIFVVLLNQAPSVAALQSRSFGKGRIIDITVKSTEVSGEFDRSAKEYFTKKYGVEPKMKSEYINPGDVYSPECMRILEQVKSKPQSQVSTREIEQLASCENTAMFAALSGRATGKSSIENIWEMGEYTVKLNTRTANTYGKIDKKSEVEIRVKLDKAEAAYKAERNRIMSELNQQREKNNLQDF